MARYALITNYVNGEIKRRREYLVGSQLTPEVTIGRAPIEELGHFQVMGWGEALQAVSRIHCTLFLQDGEVFIKDGGSKPSSAGTFWGIRRLDKGDKCVALPLDTDHKVIAVEPSLKVVVRISDRTHLLTTQPEEETSRISGNVFELGCKVAELERAIAVLQAQVEELQRCQKPES